MSEFTYRKKLVIFRGVPVKKITLYLRNKISKNVIRIFVTDRGGEQEEGVF